MTMEMHPIAELAEGFIDDLARAQAANPGGAKLAMGDVQRRLRKIAAKAEPREGYEPQTIQQWKGPAVQFKGRLLAETSSKRDGAERWQEVEVWETHGGAYVAVLIGASEVGGENDRVTVTVVEPSADEDARRWAVMDALGWTDMARNMAKGLKWSLVREVV